MNPEDRHLLNGLFNSRPRSAETLIETYSDLVYRTVQFTLISKSIFFTKDDLEDYHNTIFLSLFENDYKKLRQFKGKNGCSLKSWIRVVAVRKILDSLRTQKKNLSIDDLPEFVDHDFHLQELLEKKQNKKLLAKGLETLKPRDRMFMKLHIEKGLSVSETSSVMGITTGSAYLLKHRAIEKLKAYFRKKEKI